MDDVYEGDNEDWEDWKKSEVLKISDCNELQLKLDDGDIVSEMGQTVLMVENVNKLEIDFAMTDAPSRVSNIYVCIPHIYL